MISDELRAFAENPDRYVLAPADGVIVRHDDERVCVVVGPSFASVCAPNVEEGAVAELLAHVRSLAPVDREPKWFIGPSARPAAIAEELVRLGLRTTRDGVERVHALAIAGEPAAPSDGIEARPVASFEEFAETAEQRFECFHVPEERRERERQHLEQYYAESQRLGVPVWFVAYLDGRVAGSAGALPGTRGVFLIGGSTARWAQGRGVYRALVRARWEDAVARGTPALVTHAMPDSSYPILLRLGFEEVCEIRVLEDRPA